MKKTVKKNFEFRYILKNGKFVTSDLLCVYVLKNNKNYNRTGIIVSRKSGKAVKRNKIKRIIREAYRKNDLVQNYDILIMWKNKNNNKIVDYNKILLELNNTFKKMNILKEKK